MRLIVVSRSFADSPNLVSERWYGTQFRRSRITPAQVCVCVCGLCVWPVCVACVCVCVCGLCVCVACVCGGPVRGSR